MPNKSVRHLHSYPGILIVMSLISNRIDRIYRLKELHSAVCRSHQRCATSISGVPLTLSGVPLTSAVCRFHQRCAASISGVPLTAAVSRLHQRCEYIYNLY